MTPGWIRFGRIAVVVVGVIVAALSYAHIRDLALNYGGDSLTAPLLPLGIDGAVVAMTVFMHQATGLALWLSRFGLLVAIGMTVAFNTAYGAAFGVTGAVVWSSPAVLLVICIEVSVLTVRRTQPVTESSISPSPAETYRPASVSAGEVTPAAPVVEPVIIKPRKTTAKQEAVILNRSLSAVQRYRRDGSIGERLQAAMANGNGKH